MVGRGGGSDQVRDRRGLAVLDFAGDGLRSVCGALDAADDLEGHGIRVSRPARETAFDRLGFTGRSAVVRREYAERLRRGV